MHVLDDVNSFSLDPELLAETMEAVAKLPPLHQREPNTYFREVAQVIQSHGLTAGAAEMACIAIHFRLSALAKLIREGGARGFVRLTADRGAGRHVLDMDLVRCAAAEPLMACDGPICFDQDSFQRHLLATMTSGGRA